VLDRELKFINKITYPNEKIHFGKDLADNINYFASVESEYIVMVYARMRNQVSQQEKKS